MTKKLDDQKLIKKLDSGGVLASVSLLPDQIRQAWQEVSELKVPESFQKVANIVVAGMGGSALGARIIDSLSFEVLDLPLEIVNGYHLPAYADRNTLVVVSSYSGNTQETLSCCLEAIKKKCRIFAIATGGKLASIASQKDLPAYIFSDRYNPSKEPRLGLGYSISAQLALLALSKLIRVDDAQITEVVNYLEEERENYVFKTKADCNPAKKLAIDLEAKQIILVASEHLTGAAHAFKNMLNENSKTFAASFDLPEMNHHLLEGLAFPKANQDNLKFLFLESSIYDSEILARFKITKDVVEKNNVRYYDLILKGRTRLSQVFETVYLGGFVSAYLAFLNGLDPSPIPWVDYFKKTLKNLNKATGLTCVQG